MTVLKIKSKGKDVKTLQEALNKQGAKPKLNVDGIFGQLTLAAVKTFQKKAKLKPDGVVGKQTQGSIRAGGALPQMKVRDFKESLRIVLTIKGENTELHRAHTRFAKTIDEIEDSAKVQMPKALKLVEDNQKHWEEMTKICREIVTKQAEFDAIRLSHPQNALKLTKECEKLYAKYNAIGNKKINVNVQNARKITDATEKSVKNALAKLTSEIKAIKAKYTSALMQ